MDDILLEVQTSFARAFDSRAFTVDADSVPSPYEGTMKLKTYQTAVRRVIVGEVEQDLYIRTPSGTLAAKAGDRVVLDGEESLRVVKPSAFDEAHGFKQIPEELLPTEHPHVYLDADNDFLPVLPLPGGNRMPLELVVAMIRAGTNPKSMEQQYPGLTGSQIFDAMSYALDHMPVDAGSILTPSPVPTILVPR